MAEEEEEEWYESWERGILLTTKQKITAGSMAELLQLVDEYLQNLNEMDQKNKPRIPVMNFTKPRNPKFRGLKILPTIDDSWQAILFFDDKIDLSRR